jgi:hypothetical protein
MSPHKLYMQSDNDCAAASSDNGHSLDGYAQAMAVKTRPGDYSMSPPAVQTDVGKGRLQGERLGI